MERVTSVMGGCREARRIWSELTRRLARGCAVRLLALPAAIAVMASTGNNAAGQAPSPLPTGKAIKSANSQGSTAPVAAPAPASRPNVQQAPPSPGSLPSTSVPSEDATSAAPRFNVRDEFGQCVVARLHGRYAGKTALILPDGQLGTPNLLVPTSEPFKPYSAAELKALLHNGPFAEYQVLATDHYLIFYKSTAAFAQDSGRLLEDLYRGLIDAFTRSGIPVHESEFPLVAVIFATERDFRAHRQVDPQVRAYYQFFTNRIFFFQNSERDQIEPKLTALLKPQTVAHEGAHQILSNIGVQPRPTAWPAWLVEGLAEYCATTVNTKKGIMWSGLGAVNSLHMATIRELEDPLANQVNTAALPARPIARKLPVSPSEALLLKTSLTPTDYAEAWALTHYLAQKRGPEFVNYLKAMNQIPPLEPRSPEENLAEFRRFFSEPAAKLDKKLADHIHKLSQKRNFDSLYYYRVVFQQSLGNGVIHRAATVSQSPQIIQKWLQEMTSPNGDVPVWEVTPWPTRARAEQAAQEWMRGF